MGEIAKMENKRTSLVAKIASKYEVDPDKMMATLKATAFKGNVSNEQMLALLVVADQHNLNPFTRELFAFPDKANGIVPVVSVDGWSRIINDHPQFDGVEFKQDDEQCTAIIYRKDRSHPTSITERMSECRRNTSTWTSHPWRMLRHKALIQCARLAFGFSGIYDPDEADRIRTSANIIEGATESKTDVENLNKELGLTSNPQVPEPVEQENDDDSEVIYDASVPSD